MPTAARAVSGRGRREADSAPASRSMPSGYVARAQGARALSVTWDESGAEKRGSERLVAEYRALAQQPGTVAGAHGDAEAALARAERRDRGRVRVSLSGARADGAARRLPALGRRARAGAVRQPVADRRSHDDRQACSGCRPSACELETMLAGGSFGRRAQPDRCISPPSWRRSPRRSARAGR